MRFFRILNIPRKVEEITVTIIQRDQKQNNFLAANKTNLRGLGARFLGLLGIWTMAIDLLPIIMIMHNPFCWSNVFFHTV